MLTATSSAHAVRSFAEAVERPGALNRPITPEHAPTVGDLPHHRRDPFDRLLMTQEQQLGAALVTADRVLAELPGETLPV